MQLALGASLAVHAALLTVRFVDPERFNRVFEDTPLEVILVNARTNDKPDKAQALAQANMAGGGELDRGRATTPLPASALTAIGDAIEEQTNASTQTLLEQQQMMLAQVRTQLAALRPPEPLNPGATPEQITREEKRRRLIKLLAEIERRIQEENARPKKRYVSPATREVPYAVYYDTMRRMIEDMGTTNFPTFGGKKLYGELTMLITVNHDGHVLATEVVDSSGMPVLDRRAELIARSAGPFGGFTDEMRRSFDQLVLVSRFKFTRDELLEAKVSGK
ncbi:MAG: energy transducer TonB [Burkholderiaceae bacterium]|nr:energy transducer TonB [Rhodoferax sp.]MCB2042394.1 energy transducer TonB [Rhodoferax sp.]MCP5262922.1 energy transducer TonB [Rhodoferax sp.]MCW5628365.1 energy transducer TonB [Rhodoferax sp.]MCW5641807.1 energy transducer TonB [Rhodoferax sp.]